MTKKDTDTIKGTFLYILKTNKIVQIIFAITILLLVFRAEVIQIPGLGKITLQASLEAESSVVRDSIAEYGNTEELALFDSVYGEVYERLGNMTDSLSDEQMEYIVHEELEKIPTEIQQRQIQQFAK